MAKQLKPNPVLPPIPPFSPDILIRRDFQVFDVPEIRFWPKRCKIKMLIVSDANFDKSSSFGLGKFLKAFDTPILFTDFSIVKASRQATDSTADLTGFKFDSHDLTQYDVIWIFAIDDRGSITSLLSDMELRKISEYMHNGGGLFATGDHADLGVAICGRIPRVRSMRRWHWPSPGPNGEPVAPAPTGNNINTIVSVGSQSDAIPQNIRPRMYSRWNGGLFGRRVTYPHPVLCGSNGVIKVMPDHMHEGVCEVPADLTKSFTFSGFTIEEYPSVGGVRVSPEVIAWGVNQNNNTEFGLISVFDGHKTSTEGRVLTDATWHHFFNINLNGFDAGASTDPAVKAIYDDIQAYYRNIAYWLAPRNRQQCFRTRGYLWLQHHTEIRILVQPDLNLPKRLEYLRYLGTVARNALGDLASQCQSYTFWWPILKDLISERDFLPWVDPEKEDRENIFELETDTLSNIAIGGAVHELVRYQLDDKDKKDLSDKNLEVMLRRGALIGVKYYLEAQEKQMSILRGCIKNMQ